MDMLGLFTKFRSILRAVDGQCTRFAPKFADGTAKATWLEDGINYAFDSWRAQLTTIWLLSDATHDLVIADYEVSEAMLAEFGILNAETPTLAILQSQMVERNRPKFVEFARLDKDFAALPVGTYLAAVDTAMRTAQTEALNLINTAGDVQTIKYVTVDGVVKKVGKTFTEMGINGTQLAADANALSAATRDLIRVV